MKHFNYFLLDPAAKNRVNCTVIAAKLPENTGGGDSQYCALRSEGAQVTLGCSAVVVPMTSYGAPDEHPMSIRSASDERRWKPAGNKQSISMRSFTRLAAMVTLLLTLACGNMWGATKTITFSGPTSTCDAGKNITLSATTNITESVTLSTGISFTNSGYALSATSGDNKSCTYSSTSYKIPQLYSTGGTKSNWSLAGAISQYVDITLPAGSSFTLSSIAWALDAQSTAFTAYIGVSGGLISYKSASLSVSNSTSATTGTLSSLNQSWVGGTTYRLYVETTGPSNTGKYFGICKLVLTGEYSAPAASEWQVKGLDDGKWAGFNMTGSGTVSVSRSLEAKHEYEFKLYNTSTSKWWGNGTTYKMTRGETIVQADAGANCKLRTSKAGTYTFSFNTSTKELTVTYPDDYKGYWTKNGASWSKVYAYCYMDGDDSWRNADWPGVEITSQTEDICGTHYYINTSGYTTVIFNNGSSGVGNQTGNIAISGGEGKHAVGAAATAFEDFSTYTISYAANGGGSSMSNQTNIACGTDKTTTSNAFTAPDGYQFAGWKADVDVTIGGSTKTAGTVLANGVTIQNISSNITLTAQWELIPTYDVTYDANSGGTGTTASQTGNLDAAQVTTRDNGFTPNSGKKFKWWNTASGGGGEDFYPGEKVTIDGADVALYAQWETVASNQEFWTPIGASASSGKAISITEGDMSISSGGVTDAADINVDLTAKATKVSKYSSSTEKHAKVLAIKNDDKYIQVSFTDGSPINKLWLGTTTNSTDKKNLVVLYSTTADFSTGEYEKVTVKVNGYEQTSKAVFDFSPSTTDKYLYARIYRKISTAVYSQTGGDGATTRIYSIKAEKGVSCSTPAAPTNFTAGSISATGATFTITDAADAASYDIYYSTESTAPTSGTAATTTSTSKTKEVTGLTAATTYYAWVRSVCDASHKSAWVALNPGGDTHTFATSCVAPATVNVTATVNEVSGYWFYPGDDVVLTATPTGSPAGSPVTYQWKKNGSNVGTNSATLTINDAAASDAGKYTCTISYGACSTTSAEFELKCMQFYLKNSGGSDISNHALTKVDATHATLSLSLTGGTTYKFRVTDGCNNWYGNSDETGMTSSNCSNWTMPHDADCKVTTSSKSATYTFNFDFSAGLLGSEMKVSVVYPAGDQAEGKVIYWDNSVLNWASAPWYRIGKGTHNNKTQMTLVPGTANLYKITTTEYNGFEYWHIANNEGEGTGNIFWTKDSDPATNEAITAAMGFEGSPVTADAVTFTPTSSHATGSSSENDNCEFYEYGQQNGMKTDRVTISDYSNGTITVNYVDTDEEEASFTSGYADLAHTVKLTSITAVANTGYDAGAITINDDAYETNYVVTGATTIAATFSPQVYLITYKDQDGAEFSGVHADGYPTTHTYATATTLKTASKTGYTFDGWYGNSACTGDPMTSIGATSITADITLYAKWTAAASLTAISADVLYQAAEMANITFTGEDQNFTGLSTNNLFKVYGDATGATKTAAKGKNENHDVTDDISEKNFTSALYILSNSNTTSTDDPTEGAIEIITPSTAGLLYLYLDANNSSLTLKKKGTKTSTSLSGATYMAMEVDANTHYFINGSSSGKRGLYGIQYVSTYAVTITPTNVTKATGDGTAIKGKAYTATFTANTGYALPDDATVTIGGVEQTKGTGYTWTISAGTATLTVPAAKVTGAISIAVSGVALPTHTVSYSGNGSTSGDAPTDATEYLEGADVTVLGKNTLVKTNNGFAGWNTATDGNGTWRVQGETFSMGAADVALYAQWVPTANLTVGTLYTAGDMKAKAIGSSTGYRPGYSSNGIFELLGVGTADDSDLKNTPMQYTTDGQTIDGTEFTHKLDFRGQGAGSPSGTTLPTARAIKFHVGESGTLHLWVRAGSKINIVKDGSSASAVGSSTDRTHETVEVTAGTWYLYATGTSTSLYGMKLMTCTDPELAYGTTAVEKNVGDAAFTNALTNSHSVSVTYSSSDTDVATVNSSTGEVTIKAAGETTITATFAGNATYCADDASYTLTVTDPATTPIIVYNLNVGTSAGTTLKSSVDSGDDTNVTESNIDIDTSKSGISGSGVAGGGSTTSEARSAAMSIKTGANGADWSGEPTNYVVFKYKVACGKKLIPSKVSMKVSNKGSSSKDNIKYKAVMSDGYGHTLTGTYVVGSQDGTVEEFAITNSDPDVYFQGNVTLKLWAWTIAEKSDGGAGFRMGTPVQIFGVIADQATPTATITWTKQPAGGLSGTNETVTAVSSDGSTVTITSHNGSVATVAGSTVSYVGVGSTYLTASGTDACGNTMVSVNSDNFTVIGAYDLNYDANTGTGTMTGETGVHYAVVKDNGFTAPSGKVFYGWNTAADGTGDSYQPGDAIELNANTTLYAQWGTALTATWSVTKVDSKLYRGGGGYSVTVYLDDEDWNASGNKDNLELTATEGVTLKNIVKSINGDDKAQVTADFDITTGVDADATSITFTLFVPAAGSYASAELTDDEGLTSCAERSVTVTWTPTSDDITTLTSKDNGVLTIGTGSNVFKIYAIRGNSGSGSDAAMAYSAGNGLEFNDNNYYKSGIETYVPTSSNDISDISFYVKTSNSGRNTIYDTHDTSIQSSNPSTTLTLTTDFAAYSTKSSTLWNSCSKNKYYGVGGRSGGSGTVYLQKVTVTFSSGGGETPTLSWETDLSGGVDKETGDADFTFTATQDKNSLGTITYSSSNTSVATVNATTGKVHIVGAAGDATITATLAASGCFDKATATYEIHVVDNCIDEPGTVSARDLGCDGTELTVSGHTATANVSYQWYKVGSPDEAISGATEATYTATAAGEYYVIVTNSGTGHCAMASTNTVTVTAKAAATATKIVDSWYVKNGRRTPDVALVQSENAESFTVKSGSTTIWESAGSTKTGFGGCGFHMDENGIIYLNGTTAADGSGNAPSGLTGGEDETLTITVNGCGGSPVELNITIHKQESTTRKSVAFVVDGTKDGEFDADNESHSVNTALYKYLDNTASGGTGAFDLTAQNIYATTDEKAIREHYSQFDAILITDDPGTKETPSGDYKTKGYVNAFGTMVDVRPILTMEAYVSALANWKTKGIAGEPTSPNPRQYALRLECKDHEIYKAGLPNPAPGTHVWDEVIGGETYRNVVLVDHNKSPYTGLADNEETAGNKSPALQGFDGTASGSLLGLGRISNGSLQAAIERQEEPAARLLVFSIQAKALPNALTEEGKIVIKNILTYLLKTNMEEVDDCSNYFTGKIDDDWSKADNWSKTELPSSEAKVRILTPCVIGVGTTARVAQVEIVSSGKSSIRNTGKGSADCDGALTISAGGSLIVGGKIRKAEAPHFGADDLMPMDDPSKLIINTGSTAQAALIFDNDDADTKATVNLYSLGCKPSSYQYQYFAVPMEVVPVNPTFANETHGTGIYTYVYNEATSGWERRRYYDDLFAFEGLGITTKSTGAMEYTMTGNLASTATKEITLTHDGAGLNLIGNSWMAPIQIGALAEDNAGLDNQTVYIYCAGRDAVKGEATSGVTETAGQWIAIPFEAAEFEEWKATGKLSVIPAMQAFEINVSAEATLTLDYDKVVRGSTNDLNAKLRAPGRRIAANEVTMTNIRVADSKTHTDLSLFEGDRFSEAFDNGWEAEYMNGDGRSAKLYAETEAGQMAVAAMYDYEGTVVGFAPGQETEYTFSFMGEDNGYYLNDIKLQNSVRISEGETYTFTYEEGDAANRFYISRTAINAPEVPTGMENLDAAAPRVQKIIYNDKLYIIRGGRLYDATGKVVK